MNEEELDALLRSADAQALKAAEAAIDLERELAEAKDKELDALLRAADAQALKAAEQAIDVQGQLIAAKAAAASQLVTEQATGEAPPAVVVRSLMRIVNVSATVTVTASAARKRWRMKTAAFLSTSAGIISMSALLQHLLPRLFTHSGAVITAATATIMGSVLGAVTAQLMHYRIRHQAEERSTWKVAARLSMSCALESYRRAFAAEYKLGQRAANAEQTILAVALPGRCVHGKDDFDSDQPHPHRETSDPLEPASER
jgi:hypothetical protein